MQHHRLIEKLPRWRGEIDPTWFANFLGVRTRWSFLDGLPQVAGKVQPRERVWSEPPLPEFNESYFEWIDVLEAVEAARGQFAMIELGAGYGRWLVVAVAALHHLNPLPYKLVAVEPEPTHFLWLKEHFTDNDIDPSQHDLHCAALTTHGRPVPFYVGNAAGWYGQAIADSVDRPSAIRSIWRQFKNPCVRLLGLKDREIERIEVSSVTLEAILDRHALVDLVDLDVQGVEAAVLSASIDALDKKVKRVHVGTHSPEIEAELREIFSRHGWRNLLDFSGQQKNPTPFGEIEFGDGVQSWVNPRLGTESDR